MDAEDIRALLDRLPSQSLLKKPPGNKAILERYVAAEGGDLAQVARWVIAAGGEIRIARGVGYTTHGGVAQRTDDERYYCVPHVALKA